ncbi:MAG: PEP-CTERM sorting domain-containing protein [Verrucomicrobia bacterium]|nr:PEP-CTERM sorting domain-containing protein [Verrucomicrobiota bacterium]
MKKTLIAFACMLVSVGVYAQGSVNFTRVDANIITYSADSPADKAGKPVEVGAFKVGLYAGPAGTADDSLTLIRSILTGPLAGRFFGGKTLITGVAEGASAQVQIKAWSAAFDTYALAKASNDPTVYVGNSTSFAQPTGGDNLVPPVAPTSLSGLTAFTVSPVPEPSTIALGLLGASVLLFRRRK